MRNRRQLPPLAPRGSHGQDRDALHAALNLRNAAVFHAEGHESGAPGLIELRIGRSGYFEIRLDIGSILVAWISADTFGHFFGRDFQPWGVVACRREQITFVEKANLGW